MAGLLHIAALAAAGFHRCGQHWPREGRVVDPETLDPGVLDRLRAEPKLRVTEASPEAAEAAQAGALRDAIKTTIGTLERGDFAEDGAPKTDAVKKALPKGTRGVTAALVAEVWAELTAA